MITTRQQLDTLRDVRQQIRDLDDQNAPISIGDVGKLLDAIESGEGFALIPAAILRTSSAQLDMDDTPESVANKMAGAAAVAQSFNHHLGAQG